MATSDFRVGDVVLVPDWVASDEPGCGERFAAIIASDQDASGDYLVAVLVPQGGGFVSFVRTKEVERRWERR